MALRMPEQPAVGMTGTICGFIAAAVQAESVYGAARSRLTPAVAGDYRAEDDAFCHADVYNRLANPTENDQTVR